MHLQVDDKIDVQTEQRAVNKFFVRLKKQISYILAQLMEVYKDEALRPSTIKKNGISFVSDEK